MARQSGIAAMKTGQKHEVHAGMSASRGGMLSAEFARVAYFARLNAMIAAARPMMLEKMPRSACNTR